MQNCYLFANFANNLDTVLIFNLQILIRPLNFDFMKRTIQINVLFIMLILAFVFSISSCISTTSLTTARVLDKGKTEFGASVSYLGTDRHGVSEYNTLNLPVTGFEGTVRRGLGNKLEIGAKIAGFNGGTVDLKYQFLNSPKGFQGALGLSSGIYMGNHSNQTLYIGEHFIPLYWSYSRSAQAGLFTNCRLGWRNQFNDSNGNWLTTGGQIGAWYGNPFRIIGEVGYIDSYKVNGNTSFSGAFYNSNWRGAIGIQFTF